MVESVRTRTRGLRRTRGAPVYRTYDVEVVRRARLGPSFVRLTFAGPDLASFGAAGADQRVKLLLAQPGRTLDDMPTGPSWYAAWKDLPDAVRPTMRTYTVRAHRPAQAEVDIDVVLHCSSEGGVGPASDWASRAEPGNRAALLGPDRPGSGRLWGCEWDPPPSARRLLLAGDETAVPAIGAIVESLPADRHGTVCVEVPWPGDVQRWDPPAGVDVRWYVRQTGDDTAHGALLEPAVAGATRQLLGNGGHFDVATDEGDCRQGADTLCDAGTCTEIGCADHAPVLWDVPERDGGDVQVYGWLAGEAGMIKRLRRLLVDGFAIPRSSVAFMGYWRHGRSEIG